MNSLKQSLLRNFRESDASMIMNRETFQPMVNIWNIGKNYNHYPIPPVNFEVLVSPTIVNSRSTHKF